jgi:hypothetical protein
MTENTASEEAHRAIQKVKLLKISKLFIFFSLSKVSEKYSFID